jgi:hypothetical protein
LLKSAALDENTYLYPTFLRKNSEIYRNSLA